TTRLTGGHDCAVVFRLKTLTVWKVVEVRAQ
ncbi:hypothetical protein SMU36_08467, partial [Streptococcus mutans 4VF1]